jgi:hypothetical protein
MFIIAQPVWYVHHSTTGMVCSSYHNRYGMFIIAQPVWYVHHSTTGMVCSSLHNWSGMFIIAQLVWYVHPSTSPSNSAKVSWHFLLQSVLVLLVTCRKYKIYGMLKYCIWLTHLNVGSQICFCNLCLGLVHGGNWTWLNDITAVCLCAEQDAYLQAWRSASMSSWQVSLQCSDMNWNWYGSNLCSYDNSNVRGHVNNLWGVSYCGQI